MRKPSFRANVCVQCAYSQATAWRRQDVDALDVIVVDARCDDDDHHHHHHHQNAGAAERRSAGWTGSR